MEPEEILVPVDEVDDELDSELESLISSDILKIKAEQNGSANPTQTTETNPEEVPKDESVVVPSAGSTPDTQAQTEEPKAPYEFKVPVKGKFESESSYELRLQLSNLVQAKKSVSSTTEQQAIQDQIKELRDQMRNTKTESVINRSHSSNNDESVPAYVQPDTTGNTQLDQLDPNQIAAYAIQQMKQEQTDLAMSSTINDFFGKNAEFTDPDVRDVFVEFFDSNYKLEGKTPAQAIATLELAKSAMFRPDESIQERALAAAGVQKEVNAMQFPGGSVPQQGLTQDQQNSINEMVAAGISESKARALILD